MPKESKEKRQIDVSVLSTTKKTLAGRSYTKEVAESIVKSVNDGKKYTIEEVSPAERTLKKIRPYESWNEHAMADSVSARIDDNGMLMMTFELRGNRFGKLLGTVIDTNTMERIDFFPVGIGTDDKDGVVNSYTLSYVTFEVKK